MDSEERPSVSCVFECRLPSVENVQRESCLLMKDYNRIVMPFLRCAALRISRRRCDEEVLLRILSSDVIQFYHHVELASQFFQSAYTNSIILSSLERP